MAAFLLPREPACEREREMMIFLARQVMSEERFPPAELIVHRVTAPR